MLKRQHPHDFQEDEDDLDFLINQSIEHDKENEIIGFDDYMNSKPAATKQTTEYNTFDNDMFDVDFNLNLDDTDDALFGDGENLNYPSSPPARPYRPRTPDIDYMDDIDIGDIGIEKLTVKPRKTKTYDYTRQPTTGAFVTAVCPATGKNLYFAKKTKAESKRKMEALFTNIISGKEHKRSLLSKPIWKLRLDIERKNREELERIKKEIELESSRPKKKNKIPKDTSGQLWVDKYRPQNYTHLMGDERLNREVLRWVKQWDYCVFKIKSVQETQRDKQIRQYKNTFGKEPKFQDYKKDSEKTNDPLLRPEKKIMLMSGPPGFGKTTLAHVIAKHAGYNIIEINASDDRTGDVVKSKIKSALEMQAIIKDVEDGTNNVSFTQKPNLLIIDEIDGASSGGGSESFIKQLVQLATTEVSADKNKKAKGKKKGQTPLLRPIICICNDVYAPVLRPLRMIAKTVQFKKVPMMSIARRLQEICENEGLESDLRTLTLLAATTDGDLRSCLNTLQFIRGKSTSFTKEMLDEAGLGKKDMSKSLFAIWEQLFSAPNSRNKTVATQDDFDTSKYVDRFINDIMSNGEIERIMQGCFEAYPAMRFHDVALQKFCEMSEWFNFYDQVNYRANNKHEYEVYKYLPYPIVNFHRFFAGTCAQEHRVEYPRVDYETYASRKTFENLVDVFLAGIQPQKRRFLTKTMVIHELVPLLMHIITPDIKPVNQQLIKSAEKAQLVRLIDIMIEFGLSFIQEKTEDGQFLFKLEPPVEQLMYFNLSTPKSILPKHYATRQLISHEIETEILRRREDALQTRNKGNEKKPQSDISFKPKLKKVEKQISIDFFGRTIEPKPTSDKPTRMEVDTPNTGVVYKYHEGFSNAVRIPMTVKMFL